MKTLIKILFIGFLIVCCGCEGVPNIHEILNKKYDFDQIMNVSEVTLHSYSLDKNELQSAPEIIESPSKKYVFEIDFSPLNGNKELLFGQVTFETELQKHLVNNTELWLPKTWKAIGYADSLKTKMLAHPSYELALMSDSIFLVRQYITFHLGDIDLQVSTKTTYDENGIMRYSEYKSDLGATASRSFMVEFQSKDGELSLGRFDDYVFDNKEISHILQSIFGSRMKLIGSHKHYLE